MRLGSLYFPKVKDLNPLAKEEIDVIKVAVGALSDTELPYGFFKHVDSVDFFVDKTIGNSAILGHTTFFKPNRVILSPIIVSGLTWSSQSGVPNNEMAMSTVVHELTHLQQFRDWKWYGWMIVHLPFLNRYTVERWANQNGEYARNYLGKLYRSKTRRFILDRKPTF